MVYSEEGCGEDQPEQGDSDQDCLEQQICSSGKEECGLGGAC